MSDVVELNPSSKLIVPLESAPSVIGSGDIIAINDNDALFVPLLPSCWTNNVWIWRYNIHLNTWNKYIKYPQLYPKHFTSTSHSVAFDKHNNKLYLCGCGSSLNVTGWYKMQMTIIHIKANQKHTFKIIEPFNIPQFNTRPCILNTNGVTHIIAAKLMITNNPAHWIWDESKLKFEKRNEFNASAFGATMLYIPKHKNILYITYNSLFVYSLISTEWTEYNTIKIEMCDMKAMLTIDQQHVIIKGNINTDYRNRNIGYIKVLEINDNNKYILKDKYIQIDTMGKSFVWKSSNPFVDEILVIGYIKDVFKAETFVDLILPPVYIMQLIAGFFSIEMVHWFTSAYQFNKQNKRNHFGIAVKHILNFTAN